MRVTLLYFASLREALGVEREILDLPPDVDTTTRARAGLGACSGGTPRATRAARPTMTASTCAARASSP